MKVRLGIFVLLILFLPALAVGLSGFAWIDFMPAPDKAMSDALLLSLVALLLYTWGMHQWVKLRTKNSLFVQQRPFFWAVAAASVVLCALFHYLNLFAASWRSALLDSPPHLMLNMLLWALLSPAILVTRAWLGSFSGVLRWLGCRVAIPDAPRELWVCLLPPLVLAGLLGVVLWAQSWFWLMWFAPLLLLCTLQILWHESTLFSGLKYGDWGRVLTTALAGLFVFNGLMLVYHWADGGDVSQMTHWMWNQLGYVLFAWTTVQLADILAEAWRGKQVAKPRQKKPFPIPVVVQGGNKPS